MAAEEDTVVVAAPGMAVEQAVVLVADTAEVVAASAAVADIVALAAGVQRMVVAQAVALVAEHTDQRQVLVARSFAEAQHLLHWRCSCFLQQSVAQPP